MRVALCISGQPRGVQKNVAHLIENIIHPTNIKDIFIHTWFSEDYVGKPFDSSQPQNTNNIGVWDKDTLKFLETLDPISIIAEPPKLFDEFSHLGGPSTAVQTKLASGAYSIYKANQLKLEYEIKNNFKYDLVVRARLDCIYETKYNLKNFLCDNWQKMLHVAEIHQTMRTHDSYPISEGGTYSSLSDTFAYGSSEVVDVFCSVYPNFEKINKLIYPYSYAECYYGYQVRGLHKIEICMQPIKYFLSRQ